MHIGRRSWLRLTLKDPQKVKVSIRIFLAKGIAGARAGGREFSTCSKRSSI